MNVGLYFDLRNPPDSRRDWAQLYGETLELCEEADRLGAHSLWFSEHHLFTDGYLPRPLTFAAAAAARTRRARLGTAVIAAPFHAAVDLAEEAAVVDLLSGGRLELGLGAGYRVPEFELFGADIHQRYTTTDARVREVRELWSSGRLTPPPAQERIPLWLGYLGPQGARRAGRLGEGLMATSPTLLEPYLEGLDEGGHQREIARMGGAIDGFVSDDPERDWPVVREHLRYQWDSYRSHMVEGTEQRPPAPIDPDQWRDRGIGPPGHFVFGEPEHVAEAILRYTQGMPIETVWLWASIGGMDQGISATHVRSVCEQLAPLLLDRPDEEAT